MKNIIFDMKIFCVMVKVIYCWLSCALHSYKMRNNKNCKIYAISLNQNNDCAQVDWLCSNGVSCDSIALK